jgi:hypothetical protein
MPIILIVVAAVLFMAAYNNNLSALGAELKQDVTGWFPWAIAIAAIGALGKIPGFEKPAWMLLVLVFLVLVISNQSQLFSNLQNLQLTAPGASPPTPAQANPAPSPGPGVSLSGAIQALSGAASPSSNIYGTTGTGGL